MTSCGRRCLSLPKDWPDPLAPCTVSLRALADLSTCLPNDLALSSERRSRFRGYHGREDSPERTRVAFRCCNGRLDGALIT